MHHVSTSTNNADNMTQMPDNEDTAVLESETEVRERYRRLIPYMTYYVVNNYVGVPHQVAPTAQNFVGNQVEGPLARRPALQHVNQRLVQPKSRHQTQKLPENRFVPSVQYDPKELAQDADYFVPVNYGVKDTYDYSNIHTSRPPSMTP
jgi:hypothetical protein